MGWLLFMASYAVLSVVVAMLWSLSFRPRKSQDEAGYVGEEIRLDPDVPKFNPTWRSAR
jgi:hypothetical protein